MNTKPLLCCAIAVALLGFTHAAHSAPWTYRGTLNDGGAPANGKYDLRLTLLDQSKSSISRAPITLFGVDVKNGAFAVDVDFGMNLSTAPAMLLKTEVQQGASGFVAMGEPTPFDAKAALVGVCWDTEGNSGTNPATNFIGTIDAQPFVIRTQNTPSLRIQPGPGTIGGVPEAITTIGGSSANTVAPNVVGATIAGGGYLTSSLASSLDGVVVPGPNSVSGDYGTVSGGSRNSVSARHSVVGGGEGNAASGLLSTVGGGSGNTASGIVSTVAGGEVNTASGRGSAVSGGFLNCAGGDFSWAGGKFAKIRPGNQPGDGTCVANSGDADGDNGTFVWADDQLSDFISTGSNQFLVRAQGGMAINTNTPLPNTALTVNGNAAVSTTGILSFGAQTRQMISLWGQNLFGIGVQFNRLYFRTEANSGFAWFQGGTHSDPTDTAGPGGSIVMRLNQFGQLQTSSGVISALSDARLKDEVADYSGALDRINALRPVTYLYKEAGKAAFQPEGTHIGFIAQEMQQVFPQWVSTGDDGYLMLSMRGFEGVAVRAMQELSAENQAQDQAINSLRVENNDLRKRLEALEAKLSE
jgi:trimeric autotransporter adhesin